MRGVFANSNLPEMHFIAKRSAETLINYLGFAHIQKIIRDYYGAIGIDMLYR